MRFRWTALTFVLVLACLAPRSGFGQVVPQPQKPKPKSVGGLMQNYPNPMNPETWIPFSVGDYPACTEPGRLFTVTMTIFNALGQPVAVPLKGLGGEALNKLRLPCGLYKAYWNGNYPTGKKAASGNYPYILQVDGQKFIRSMTVAK